MLNKHTKYLIYIKKYVKVQNGGRERTLFFLPFSLTQVEKNTLPSSACWHRKELYFRLYFRAIGNVTLCVFNFYFTILFYFTKILCSSTSFDQYCQFLCMYDNFPVIKFERTLLFFILVFPLLLTHIFNETFVITSFLSHIF